MTAQFSVSDIIALMALVFSAWSLYQNHRFNKRQSVFEETNAKLSQILIEKETGEIAEQKKAELSANFVKIGKNHRLKIFNRGKAVAKNVRLELLDNGDSLLQQNEADRKFPVPVLETHGCVELIAFVHMGSPSRAHIKLIWDDESGTGIEKELYPTL